MFQGFYLQINKFEKATAFHFWQYIPYEMCWFLLIVKKFIPSILEAFVARVSKASIFQLRTISLQKLCFCANRKMKNRINS